MFLFVFSLIASTHFPICAAPGDQQNPDICWDGEQFWVVWDDERDDSSGVYLASINEQSEVRSKTLIYSPQEDVSYPRIDCHDDTLIIVCLRDDPDSEANHIHKITLSTSDILDNQLASCKEVSDFDIVHWFDNAFPVRCKNHYALIYTYGYDAEFEFPTWGQVQLLDSDTSALILDVPQYYGQFCYVDNAIWNGERLFCVTSYGCILLEDTLDQDPYQEGYFFPRDPLSVTNDTFEFYRGIALAASDERIGMLNSCSWSSRPWFDLVDGEGNLVNSDLLYLGLGDVDASCQGSAMAYGNGRFVAVSDLGVGDYPHWKRTLWGTEIDTNVTMINEGFLMAGPNQERNPDICFGENHFLLVWSDNRSGDWDIYGMILDSLEYSGVSEPSLIEDEYPVISVDQTVFTDVLKINLSPAAAGGSVLIHDAAGRLLRTLEFKGTVCIWDGRDSKGEPVASGVYLISLLGESRGLPVKVVKL